MAAWTCQNRWGSWILLCWATNQHVTILCSNSNSCKHLEILLFMRRTLKWRSERCASSLSHSSRDELSLVFFIESRLCDGKSLIHWVFGYSNFYRMPLLTGAKMLFSFAQSSALIHHREYFSRVWSWWIEASVCTEWEWKNVSENSSREWERQSIALRNARIFRARPIMRVNIGQLTFYDLENWVQIRLAPVRDTAICPRVKSSLESSNFR